MLVELKLSGNRWHRECRSPPLRSSRGRTATSSGCAGTSRGGGRGVGIFALAISRISNPIQRSRGYCPETETSQA